MPAPAPQRIRSLFDAALAQPKSARRDFLAAACSDDAALHATVSALLIASEASGGFLAAATLHSEGDATPQADGLRNGDWIGAYEIVSELGHGGGGVVYLAQQHQPVAREVALKILPATSAASPPAALRFRREQRTLARIEHAHIARLYDAGVDPQGRLWFAMEYIRGEPITVYCDTHQLTLTARLRLFGKICQAVHHLHLCGVIHRDLKPSNLLISGPPDHPVPRIIDLGIALAWENLDDTASNEFLGTPAYMSPEQCGENSSYIDARSDLFSLGLILSEILCGRRTRGNSGPANAAASTDEIPTPAAIFAVLPPNFQAQVASARRTRPGTLRRFLHGDAARIIRRCLSRDPAGRFSSAESLAVEVENLVDHRPLSFGKRGWLYPFRKFLRRHRTGSSLAVIAILLTLSGLTISQQAHFARLRAEVRASEQSARAAHESARAAREARKGYLITEAMTGLFRGASADYGHPTDRTVHSVVAAWTQQLPTAATEDPEVEALVRLSLGNAWQGFGENDQARHQFQAAATLLANPSPAFHPARALAELNLATLDFAVRDYPAAEARLLTARHYFAIAGTQYIGGLLRAELLLAGQRTDTRQWAAATTLASNVLAAAEIQLPLDFELHARAHWQLSRAAHGAGNTAAWDYHLRRRLALILQAPDAVPTVVLEANFDVLRADFIAGQQRSATLSALDQLVAKYQALTGPKHPTPNAFRADIAALLAETGDPTAAAARYRTLLAEAPQSPSCPEWQQALAELP